MLAAIQSEVDKQLLQPRDEFTVQQLLMLITFYVCYRWGWWL